MKFITGAFIVLLCATVSLIVGFKHISAETVTTKAAFHTSFIKAAPPSRIINIPLPEGFTRVAAPAGSFAEWLENISLRKNNTVYLYNGQPIENQELHYAVLDISTGVKDLQQCADAIMRLKAEYYFSRHEYDKIVFIDGQQKFSFGNWIKNADITQQKAHDTLLKFMEQVFINCGTYTVDAMTKPVALADLQAGDIFVKAGAPGHAMIVVDVAQNTVGEKIYLLAQGYMPAQDMHIVINPLNLNLSPWYVVNSDKKIVTPGWIFTRTQLKRWK